MCVCASVCMYTYYNSVCACVCMCVCVRMCLMCLSLLTEAIPRQCKRDHCDNSSTTSQPTAVLRRQKIYNKQIEDVATVSQVCILHKYVYYFLFDVAITTLLLQTNFTSTKERHTENFRPLMWTTSLCSKRGRCSWMCQVYDGNNETDQVPIPLVMHDYC